MRTSTVRAAGLAERGDLAGLEKAEQLRLEVEPELADFVEEEGAFPGGADEAEVVAVGAGEGAAAVAEELAFEQVAGDGGAVEGDEGLLRAVREFVDGAGEDLLAGAALAGDQDVDVGLGDLASVVHQLAHVAGDEKPITTDWHVVERPQRHPILPVCACAIEIVK